MRTKLIALMVIAALLVPAVAVAQERGAEPAPAAAVSDEVVDRPGDRARDRVTDRSRDRVGDRQQDRDRVRDGDRTQARDGTRDRDRISDRCAEVDFVTDRCCRYGDEATDRCEHPINYRQLLWRLIEAHEWQLVVRLLHHLHIL